MKFKLILLGVLTASNMYYSQFNADAMGRSSLNDSDRLRDFANNWQNNVNKSVSIDDLKKNTKGSPYFDENLYDATFNNGVRVPQQLRYDAYTDEMEFIKDGKTWEINSFDGLQIAFPKINKTYIYIKGENSGKETEGYYVLNHLGEKYSLVTKEKIELKESQGMSNGIIDNSGAAFKKSKNITYIVHDGKLTQIQKSTDLKSIAEGNEKAKEYLEKNKININNTEAVIGFVKALN